MVEPAVVAATVATAADIMASQAVAVVHFVATEGRLVETVEELEWILLLRLVRLTYLI